MKLAILNNILLYSSKYPLHWFYVKEDKLFFVKKNDSPEKAKPFRDGYMHLRIAPQQDVEIAKKNGFKFKEVDRRDVHSTASKYMRNHPILES